MADEDHGVEIVLDEPKTEEKSEIEVKIEDEKPEKKKKEAAEKVVAPEEGINELKRKLEAEKRRAEEAERRVLQANQQINKAYAETVESKYDLVVSALETVKTRGEQLKNAYSESMAVGDYNKAAEIQQAMAETAHQLAELKRGEKAMKEQIKAAEAQQVRPVDPPADPVEQMAQSVSPRSASWLRENKDVLRNDRAVRKMFRAHEDAVEDGIEPDTDEYFSFIESRLGINRGGDDEGESPMSAAAAPATPRRSVSPPAAPVSRGNGQRPGVIRLTREEAETAKLLGMTEKEYAMNKVALQEEGKLRK